MIVGTVDDWTNYTNVVQGYYTGHIMGRLAGF